MQWPQRREPTANKVRSMILADYPLYQPRMGLRGYGYDLLLLIEDRASLSRSSLPVVDIALGVYQTVVARLWFRDAGCSLNLQLHSVRNCT